MSRIPAKYKQIDFVPPESVASSVLKAQEQHQGVRAPGYWFGISGLLEHSRELSPRLVSLMAGRQKSKFTDSEWAVMGGDEGHSWAVSTFEKMKTVDDSIKEEVDSSAEEDVAGFLCDMSSQGVTFKQSDKVYEPSGEFFISFVSLRKGFSEVSDRLVRALEILDHYSHDSQVEEYTDRYSLMKAISTIKKADVPAFFAPLQKALIDFEDSLVEGEYLDSFKENNNKDQSPEGSEPSANMTFNKLAKSGLSSLFQRFYVCDTIPSVKRKSYTEDEKDSFEKFALGIVLEPTDGSDGEEMTPDTDNDVYSAQEVEKAAHWYMENQPQVGLMHGPENGGEILAPDDEGIKIIESYITRIEIPENHMGQHPRIKQGTWLMAFRVNREDVWEKVLNRVYNGLSIGGVAMETPVEEEVN